MRTKKISFSSIYQPSSEFRGGCWGGGGGTTKRQWGTTRFNPTNRGGGREGCSHAEVGRVVLTHDT